ncbi:DUF4369 domain-containing protein [Constantimarinum furrinae]|uniref:DUF4369 domain-containing protein n=1 Tax=Constantimarinum furrinae TaxID=2562285 RepID=A0A7G8PVB4_9FLAO|nr:DUF4369 domain-containing protein [Constantimarinum furrinae]QNJ98280.1 hypothetical protein ALE3EI_1729 [Constantimarinum furrinae]
MKQFFFGIIVILIVASCSSNENKMILTGEVNGLKKGTLLLQKIEDTLVVTVDSVMIDGNSSFYFSEEIVSPEIFYLYLRLKDGTLRDDRITFFGEPSEIHITTTLKDFGTSPKITGSLNQDKIQEYNKLIARYNDKNLELIQKNLAAGQQKSDSAIRAFQKQQNDIVKGKYLATVNFALNHPDYEMSPYLILSEVFDANIKYLDTVYKALTPKIKDSKYGKQLESYIENRKNLTE